MKKYYFLLAVILLLGQPSFAQVILDDTFKDNSNHWPEYNTPVGKLVVKTKLDQYHFYHKRKIRILAPLIELNLDESRDFRIETLMYKVGGTKESGYGVMWGAKDDENFYSFLVVGTGEYLYGKAENGKWQNITDGWKDHTAIDGGRKGHNKLVVEKRGRTYTLSVNGAVVAKVPYSKFYGNKIGFNVNRKQKIMAEYIKVEYLK